MRVQRHVVSQVLTITHLRGGRVKRVMKNQIIIAHQELAAIAICGRLVLSRWHVSVNHLNCEQVKTLKPELEGKDQHYLPDRLVASFALEDIQQTAIGQCQSRHL